MKTLRSSLSAEFWKHYVLSDRTQRRALLQHAMPTEFGGKWGTECVSTKFPAVSSMEPEAGLILVFLKRETCYVKHNNPLVFRILLSIAVRLINSD